MNITKSSLSVMMIDDNEVDRMMGRRLAERSGVVERYVGFPSAIEALAHLNMGDAPEYDVILLDQSMPNMDGVSFLREAKNILKERLPKTSIVMLTTILADDDRAKAESLGMIKQFLLKPLSTRKFADLLQVAG